MHYGYATNSYHTKKQTIICIIIAEESYIAKFTFVTEDYC